MSREYKIRCPDAIHIPRRGKPDRHPSFSINPEKNLGRCWSCQYATRDARSFCERHGIELKVVWGAVSARRREDPRGVRLPAEFTEDFTSFRGPAALQYLTSRGLSRLLIASYGIGYCPNGSHSHRIIVPVLEQGMLVNFQGRDWSGLRQPKYLGPLPHHGVPDSDALFNLDRAARSRVIVLVEGTFDALRLPKHCVAILGSRWSPEKRAKLLKADPLAVFVALDPDASTPARELESDLKGVIPYVRRYVGTAKDLGEAQPPELARLRRLCDAAETACGLLQAG